MPVVVLTPGAVSGSFTPLSAIYDQNSGTEAVWTDATRRGTSTTRFSNVQGIANVPADAVNIVVTAVLTHRESISLASITAAGVAVPISDTSVTDRIVVSEPATAAEIPTSYDVVHTRANNTTSTTCYITGLHYEVSFDIPVVVPAEVWNGSSWRSDAEVWTGSKWTPL
jgi:hypothetical protein